MEKEVINPKAIKKVLLEGSKGGKGRGNGVMTLESRNTETIGKSF